MLFWSHDRGTAKLRMKLVRKNGIPQSLPEGTTVPIRLMFKSATAEGGYGKHDYLATVEDPVNGIVFIVLEDNILGYVGKVEGSVYIDFPNDRSLDTAGRFTFISNAVQLMIVRQSWKIIISMGLARQSIKSKKF